jgi:glycosyltransferase involved in cell wall biosynthesis
MSTASIGPEVSVVLSTYNRARVLPRALASLAEQDLDHHRYEVIVVNNNSTDETARIAEAFCQTATNVRYLFEPKQGLSHARNAGIGAAAAPIVAFTDDDVRAAPDWVSTIARLFAEHPEVECVGGKVLPNWPGPWPEWLTREHWAPLALVDYGESEFHITTDRRLCLIGANSAYRRATFDRIGLYSPHVQAVGREVATEDHEMLLRLWRAGGQALYSPYLVITADIEADRMGRRYHRRWHRRHGRFLAIMRDEELERTALGRFLGVPAHVYRRIPLDLFAWFVRRLRGDSATAFVYETRLWFALGFVGARWREFFSPRRASLLRELTALTSSERHG